MRGDPRSKKGGRYHRLDFNQLHTGILAMSPPAGQRHRVIAPLRRCTERPVLNSVSRHLLFACRRSGAAPRVRPPKSRRICADRLFIPVEFLHAERLG